MFLQHDRLKDVTPEDLVRVAKTYFKASNRTVGYYIPDAAPDRTVVPRHARPGETADGLQEQRDHLARRSVRPHARQYREARGARQARQWHEGGDAAQEDREQPGHRRRSNCASATPATLTGKNGAAQFAGSLLMARHQEHHTREQMRDEMQKLNARISVSGGGGGGGFGGGRGGRGGGGGGGGVSSANANITAPAANFEAAMRLAVEMLKEPAIRRSDFDRIQQQRIKALDLTPTEPTQLGAEMLSRHLSPFAKGDVHVQPDARRATGGNEEGHAGRCQEVPRPVLRRQFRRVRRGGSGGSGGGEEGRRRTAGQAGIRRMAYKPIAAQYKKR